MRWTCTLVLFGLLFAHADLRAERRVMSCVLTGPQAEPAVVTPGFGAGRFVVDTASNTIEYRITMTDLIGLETAAIIHGPAVPGIATAGHLFSLPFGPVKSGILLYDEADESMILSGLTYVNIHTSAFPLDEIRGQIVDANCLLSGAEAATPSASHGWGGFTIDREANTVSYFIEFEALEGVETAAFIRGAALHEEVAPVLHTLPSGSPKLGVWTYDESLESAVENGLLYVSVESSAFPSGELRGQITPFVCPVDRGQAVPPTTSNGAGLVMLAHDVESGTVSYAMTVSGLDGAETATTLHGFAAAGATAPTLLTLDLGGTKIGSWEYSPTDTTPVTDGLAYMAVQTSAYPGSELRGQLRFGAPVVGFRRGDANSDGGVDIGDAVTILDVLFGGSPHFCQDAIDTNDDGLTNIADAVYLLSNLFSMGPELPAPTENCGDDPTMDERSCASYDGC